MWVRSPIAEMGKRTGFPLPNGGNGIFSPVYIDNFVDGLALAVVLRSFGCRYWWSVLGERCKPLVAAGDQVCPGPSAREAQCVSSAGGDDASGHGQ